MSNPRVLFAGASSGSGKTTAVCAVLSLLKRRGVKLNACKCGPDYIDPMFHSSVLGIECSNLDPFFCDRDLLCCLLNENAGEELTVIEGVMGYYDGTGEDGTDNSTYTVASQTETPVILVLNAKGAAASLLAQIEGFLNFCKESRIKGVLFNRMTEMNYKNISHLLKRRFGNRIVPVGFIPELPEECIIPSRHLGLVTADEITELTSILQKTADICESTIDISSIIEIANNAEHLSFSSPTIPHFDKINLAVARDEAFCFYYKDTISLFEKMGAHIKYFSPLANEELPKNADGLLLGGGYPELYSDILEKNTVSRESVKNAVISGMPTIAECGGFQYLGNKLDGKKMCGVLSLESFETNKLVRFGYVTLTAKEDNLLGPVGSVLKAHEFHYWDSTDTGNSFIAEKPSGKKWNCIVSTPTLYAGYPHLFLYADISAAKSFYKKCLQFRENRQ